MKKSESDTSSLRNTLAKIRVGQWLGLAMLLLILVGLIAGHKSPNDFIDKHVLPIFGSSIGASTSKVLFLSWLCTMITHRVGLLINKEKPHLGITSAILVTAYIFVRVIYLCRNGMLISKAPESMGFIVWGTILLSQSFMDYVLMLKYLPVFWGEYEEGD